MRKTNKPNKIVNKFNIINTQNNVTIINPTLNKSQSNRIKKATYARNPVKKKHKYEETKMSKYNAIRG
jgi:hypothetical protein